MICPTRIDIINSSVPSNHVVMSSLQASARLSTNTEEPDVRIFMRWEIKRRRNANLRKLSQLHSFSFFKCKFQKCLMTAKAMHKRCTIEHSFGWRIIYMRT